MSAKKTVARLVVEFRRSKKWFEFFDVKGGLIDQGSQLGFEQVNITDSSFTLASDNRAGRVFVSTDNFGFQIDHITDISAANGVADQLFELFKNKKFASSIGFSPYRLGTKIDLLFSPKRQDINKVTRIFRQQLMKSYVDAEDALGVRTSDYALVFTASNDSGKLNIQLGPASTDEATTKYFAGDKEYAKLFEREAGFFGAFDLFREDLRLKDLDQLKDALAENITGLEDLKSNFESTFTDVD